jgi:alpha-tubulin suppressor-like RCC1 family protein
MSIKSLSIFPMIIFILVLAFFSGCSMQQIEKNGNDQASIESLEKAVGAGSMVRQVAAGNDFSMAIVKDGPGNQTLWVIGNNASGQLGLGDTKNRLTWQNSGLNQVRYVSCNQNHSMCVVGYTDSTLYVTGDNSYGQLGLGYTGGVVNKWTNTNLNNISQVACGYYHNLLITNSGNLYVAGNNYYGQLGIDPNVYPYVNLWRQTTTSFIADIACGAFHSICIGDHYQGHLYVTGNNYYGQLGLGYTGGYVSQWTKINLVTNSDNSGVMGIACGNYNSICYAFGYLPWSPASGASNWLWVTGDNTYGEIGFPSNVSNVNSWTQMGLGNISRVACGANHSMFLTSTGNSSGYGSLWVTGNNNCGQLGLGDTANRYGWQPAGYANIRSEIFYPGIAGGQTHSLFISQNQTWGAGNNNCNQLGVPSLKNIYYPWFVEN